MSEWAAQQQAQAFFAGRGRMCVLETAVHAPALGEREDAPAAYHIFNVADEGGFVIVSGDDRAVPVLGYADAGYLDPEHMPEGLQDLLEGYAEEIETMGNNGVNGTHGANRVNGIGGRHPILPMIKTRWAQSTGTNLYSPIVQTSGSTKQTPAGCVPLAIAQVLYYYRWPAATTQTVPSYYCPTLEQQMDSLPVTTFDYDLMSLTYNNQSDSASMREVSKLTLYTGYAIDANYGPTGTSGSPSKIPWRLMTYFDYDSSAVYLQRQDYTYEGWVEMLYNELIAGRPVIYSGFRLTSGHSFLCDGYDTYDYFHFNFGWGGECDGYYRVSALNPILTNGNTRYGDGGYTNAHNAVIGVRPNTGAPMPYTPIKLTNFTFHGDTTHIKVYHRDSVGGTFPPIPLRFSLSTMLSDTTYYEGIINVFDMATGEMVDEGNPSPTFSLVPGYNSTNWISIAWNREPSNTLYQIRFQTRLAGTEEWKDCVNSDQYYLTAKVDSLTMTVYAERTLSVTPYLLDMCSQGPHIAGMEDTVTARIVALDGDYMGPRMYMCAVRGGVCNDMSSQQVWAKMGDTVTVQFTYKPSRAGVDTLYLFDDYNWVAPLDTVLYDGLQVPIAEDPINPYSEVMPLSISVEVKNLVDSMLYGNSVQSVVTLINQSPDSARDTNVYCRLRRWRQNADGSWRSQSLSTHKFVTVNRQTGPTPDTLRINLERFGIASRPDSLFSILFTNTSYINDRWVEQEVCHLGFNGEHGVLRVQGGYRLCDATGMNTLVPDADTVRCEDACFVDLRTKDLTGAVVIPSSNPNCMYQLKAPVPAVLSGLNVVVGSTADSVILHEGHDFFCPNSVLAHTVRLTREMTTTIPNWTYWNRLTLPFEPSEISEEVHAYKPVSDDVMRIILDEASSIEPYQPYFVLLPYDSLHYRHNVTFSAYEYTLTSTPEDPTWEGELYTVGTSCREQEIAGAWQPNAFTETFRKAGTSATVSPFGVWVKPKTLYAEEAGSVVLSTPVVTGTEEVVTEPKAAAEDNAWYTLTGIRLSKAPTAPGAYIHNRRVEIVR